MTPIDLLEQVFPTEKVEERTALGEYRVRLTGGEEWMERK